MPPREWFYVRSVQGREERVGPLDEAAFEGLVRQSVITPTTMVWNAELKDWTLYGGLPEGIQAAAAAASTGSVTEAPAGGPATGKLEPQPLRYDGRARDLLTIHLRNVALTLLTWPFAGFTGAPESGKRGRR